jgi:hypothetical protein
MLVRYEDLVRSPQASLDPMMRFLGLSFEAGQLGYHEEPVSWYGAAAAQKAAQDAEQKATATAIGHPQNRNRQINQPLFDSTGSYSQHLDEGEIRHVRRSCQRLAQSLGYDL